MYVFFSAKDKTVELHVEDNYVGCAENADELLGLLVKNNVTGSDEIYNSSSVDFASEEGFATDDCAHAMINTALAKL
jgi:hypothetical protein